MTFNTETPGWIKTRLLTAGGRNRYGEANYRVVWSSTRLETIGGEWDDYSEGGIWLRTVVETRRVPKYWTHPDRWIVEKWLAPEEYGSPESWRRHTTEFIGAQAVAQLGPYPDRGDYELAFVVEDQDGDYVPLTEAIVEGIIGCIEASRSFSSSQRKAALLRREEKKQEAIEKENEDMVGDAMLPFRGANGEVVLAEKSLFSGPVRSVKSKRSAR
jgi:hypothetical protein